MANAVSAEKYGIDEDRISHDADAAKPVAEYAETEAPDRAPEQKNGQSEIPLPLDGRPGCHRPDR